VKPYSFPYFFGFGIEADSVRIQIWNWSLSVTNTDQIWSEYGSVEDKYFVGSLVDIKVKIAHNFFYIHKYLYSYETKLCLAWWFFCTIRQNV
jgi:hypothetical protein